MRIKNAGEEKEVFAVWEVGGLSPLDPEDVHISCGQGEEQREGYFLSDTGSKLLIESTRNGYRVTFTAPALSLGRIKNYWLSPCLLGACEVEAVDFGMRLVGAHSIKS